MTDHTVDDWRQLMLMRCSRVAASLLCSVIMLTASPAFCRGRWSAEAPLPAGRDLARAATVKGILYVLGGHTVSDELSTVEFFDPATHSWKTRAPMPTPRHQMAVGVINGIVYVAGGCCPTSNALEAFDPRRNTWTIKAPMPIATEPVGAVENGILYAIGGNARGLCTNAMQAYDPNKNSWKFLSPMPTPRCHLAAAAMNGLIYAIGGTNTSGSVHLRTVEVYNPRTDTWSTATDMPTGRCLLTAVPLASKIYVLGGNNPELPQQSRGPINTYLSTSDVFQPRPPSVSSTRAVVEIYDPSMEKWITGIPLPTARTGLAVGVVGNTIYAVGSSGSATILTTNETFSAGEH